MDEVGALAMTPASAEAIAPVGVKRGNLAPLESTVNDGDGTDAHDGGVEGEMLYSQSSIQVLKNQNKGNGYATCNFSIVYITHYVILTPHYCVYVFSESLSDNCRR